MPRKKDPDIQAARQAQILTAARTIFAEQGFANARMDDIAAACGLSKGTLYLYYKSKDDLIFGLLQASFDDLLQGLTALLEQTDQPVAARFLGYADAMSHQMSADASLLNIAYEFYAVAARQPLIRGYLSHYFSDYRHQIAALLAQGVAAGEFAPHDIEAAALLLVAILEGLTLLWFTDAAHVDLERMLTYGLQQFFKSLQ